MNKKLQPYDYINSLNGSEAIYENHQEFTDYVMKFQDAFQTAMRFSKELINAQQNGTIQIVRLARKFTKRL